MLQKTLVSALALFLLAAPQQALAAKCGNVQELFVFNPPSLLYNATEPGAKFTVSMTQKPNRTADVILSLPGFKFDTPDGVLTFTDENYQIPQEVVVVAESSIINAGTAALKMNVQIDAPCMPAHRCEFPYFVNKATATSKTCIVSGDPHFSAFDGSAFDYQGVGGMYYLKSESLEVQGFQYPCSEGNPLACVGAASIRYGDSIVLVNGMAEVGSFKQRAVNGAELTRISEDGIIGVTYTPEKIVNSPTFTFTTDDGSTVVVNWNSFPYLSVTINLSPALQGGVTGGLCAVKGGKYQDSLDKILIPNEDYHMHKKFIPKSVVHPLSNKKFWGPNKFKKLSAGVPRNETTYNNVCVVVVEAKPQPPPQVVIDYAIPPMNPNNPQNQIFQQLNPGNGLPLTSGGSSPGLSTGGQVNQGNSNATTPSAVVPVAQANNGSNTAPTVGSVAKPNNSTTASNGTAPANAGAPVTVPSGNPANAANNAASQVIPVGQPHVFEALFTATDLENALKQCRDIINVPGCRGLKAMNPVYETNAIAACAKDFLRTGGHVFTNSHLQGYMAQCQQIAHATVNSPVVIANNGTAKAAAVIVTAGYGKNECPNACSGKGVCSSIGCQCVSPFSGIDCSIDTTIYAPPAQAPVLQYNNGTQVQGVFCNPVQIAQNPIVQAAINIPVAQVDYTPQPVPVQVSAPVAIPAVAASPAGVNPAASVPVSNPVPVVIAAPAKPANAAPAAVVSAKAPAGPGNVLASGALESAAVSTFLFIIVALV
ncbi:hypothetical protein HDU78_007438 [Chytriomyces hyalinus]|nr:hypothetical protein HDU78_007438 [Chytriomyces hyalinus]